MNISFPRLALVSLISLGTAFAGQSATTPPAGNPPPQHVVDPQKQVQHLTRKLALTADQQNQILPILTDRQSQIESLRSDTTLTPKERARRLRASRHDSEAKIRNILTDTQKSAYDQMQADARERARSRRITATTAQ